MKKNRTSIKSIRVLSLLLLVITFFVIGTEGYGQSRTTPHKTEDTVITDIAKINWQEVQLSSKRNELLATMKNSDRILISRRAYTDYALQRAQADTL
jgi:hypothetical protein